MRTLRHPSFWYLLLLLGFVVLRVVQSLGAVGSFDDEDGYTLAAAWEMLHHPVWPYQTYQLSEWENGSLVTVLITLPFCLLFGPSVFALKMTGLAISCVTLSGLFLLGRRFAGLSGAVAIGLLYILFPSPIYTYSVTAHGFHPDSMALQIFVIYLAVTCHAEDRASPRRFAALGLLCGLSIYFAYISVIAVLAALGPWLAARMLRRPGPTIRYLPLSLGFAAGLLPLLIFNIFNKFMGFQLYRGTVGDYLTPSAFEEKLRWFREMTATPLLHFANPVDANDPGYGLFETAFWALVIPALLLPYLFGAWRWLARRRGWSTRLPAPSLLDHLLLTFPLLTVAIFFNSKHPIGPMHVVPLLVVMVAALGLRLGQAWRHGGWPGKAVMVAVMVPFVVYTGPLHHTDISEGRLGMALVLDGRNYPLFLYRARDVFDNTRPTGDHFAIMAQEKKLDAVRSMLLTLRLEHAKNDENLVHHLLVPVLHHKEPLSELARFIAKPPKPCVTLDVAETAGLALMQLYLNRRITLAQMGDFLARQPAVAAGCMVEVLGFYLDPAPELLAVLGTAGGENGFAWQERFAFGLGRTWASRELFSYHAKLCGKDQLPSALQSAYMRGIGFGISRLAIAPLPRSAASNICPAMRADFWRGIKQAGTPGPRVLKQSSNL